MAMATPQVTESGLLTALRRDACGDRELLTMATPQEISAVAEQIVNVLWSDSRVKNFIGVFAMRDLRLALVAQEPPRENPLSLPVAARPAPSRPLVDDDVMTLSDDGTVD